MNLNNSLEWTMSFALLATVFHAVDIFSDFGYSTYFLLFFLLIIIFFFVLFLLWLTSYYVVNAYCVMCTVIWVDGVDVYNVGSQLSVCACFVGTPVCVLHTGLNDNW